MIDIHAHILWGVDDGPETLEESVELVKLAVQEGIGTLVATSHALHPSYHADREEVEEKVNILRERLVEEGIEIEIRLGHEIRIMEDMVERLKMRDVLAIHSSNFVLVEFPSGTVPLFTKEIIKQLVKTGYRPLIAHPERNKVFANNPQKLRELIEYGAFAQVTAGSVAGDFGKEIQKMSMRLIDEGLIHCYGSDVHDKNRRPYAFDKGLLYLETKNRQDIVEYFLENNERALENKNLLIIERKESVLKRKFGFLSKK